MKREAVACHEVGHAVARVDLELPITSATIVAVDDSLGRVIHTNIPQPIYDVPAGPGVVDCA